MAEAKKRRRRSDGVDEFESALEIIDGLFAEVDPSFNRSESRSLSAAKLKKGTSSDGMDKDKGAGERQRMLCSVRRLSDLESPKEARVLVSLSNIERLWQAKLGKQEFKEHVLCTTFHHACALSECAVLLRRKLVLGCLILAWKN